MTERRWRGLGPFGPFGVLVAVAALVACAHTQPPYEILSQADLAIREADQAGASRAAPLPLHRARENLEEARAAMGDDHYQDAELLAEKALADAQLASALTEAQQAEDELARTRANIETLEDEIQRSQEGMSR